MRRFLFGILIVASLTWAAEVTPIPPVEFTDTYLENGLRVIIAEDHHAPVYAIAVSYAVGSKDERPGRTGFAHLFEHMMFKGSENVGPGEHFYLIYNNGGSMNGTTNNDRTLYFETLPKNQLDLGLFLEADRMRALAVTEENLENQRQAVKEERRLRVDNQPYGRTNERIDELVYDAFAYKHSVIGSMDDLDAATIEDVTAFFKTYYAPNNAVVALVGDLDAEETLAKVKQYFGDIPSQDPPAEVDFDQPEQEAERRETIDDPLARLASVDYAYRIPEGSSPDIDVLNVMNTYFARGDSSRLYQRLVKEAEVAQDIWGFVDDRIGPGVYYVGATVRPGKSIEETEKLLNEELNRLIEEPVTDAELVRAKTTIRRSTVGSRTRALSRAQQLADNAVLFDDPGRMNTVETRMNQVTAKQIQEAAAKYFQPTNRTVVITTAGAAARGGGEPEAEPE